MQPSEDLVHIRPCIVDGLPQRGRRSNWAQLTPSLAGLQKQKKKLGVAPPSSGGCTKKLGIAPSSSKGVHKRDFSRVRGPPKSLIQVQIVYCLKPRLPSPHRLLWWPPKGEPPEWEALGPSLAVYSETTPQPLSSPRKEERGWQPWLTSMPL